MTENGQLGEAQWRKRGSRQGGQPGFGLSDSAEPEAYHHVISFWQNREGWTDNLMAFCTFWCTALG